MTSPLELDPDELRRHGAALRRIARHLLSDPHAADDVVQEAWIQALARPPRQAGSLGAWLAKAVRHLAIDRLRHSRVARRGEDTTVDPERLAAPDDGAALDASIELLEAVRALPEPYRSAIQRRYLDDLPPRELAHQDGVPVKTVKARLHRGLAMLRERLQANSGRGARGWQAGVAALLRHSAPSFTPLVLGASMNTSTIKGVAAAAALVALAWTTWSLASRGVRDTGPDPGITARRSAAAAPHQPQHSAPDSALEPETAAQRQRVAHDEDRFGGLQARVAWHDDTPAAGIELTALAWHGPILQRVLWHGKTDQQGRVAAEGLEPGAIKLVADRGAETQITIRAGAVSEADLRLERGTDLTGFVVDALDRPVPHASIVLQRMYDYWTASPVLTHADSNGRFQLRAFPGHGMLGAFSNDAPWHAPSPLIDPRAIGTRSGPSPEAPLEVVLKLGSPGAAVRGVVVDERTGAGVPDVLVVGGSARREDGRERTTADKTLRRVRTNAAGNFLLGGLDVETIALVAVADGHGPVRTRVELAANAVAAVELRIAPAATLTGTLVDEHGAPARGATVHVFDDAPPLEYVSMGQIDHAPLFGHYAAVVDGNGRFQIAGLPSGMVSVLALAGGDWRGQPSTSLARARILLPAGTSTEWHGTLGTGRRIEGRLLFADGSAAPRVPVVLIEESTGSMQSRPTDDSGKFGFAGLTGNSYHLHAQFRDGDGRLVLVSKDGLTVDGRPVEIRADFLRPTRSAPARIRGRFVDAGARVPEGAGPVTLTTRGASGTALARPDGPSGEFVLEGLRAGRTQITAVVDDTVIAASAWLELAPGDDFDLGELRSERPRSALEVRIGRDPVAANTPLRLTLRDRDGLTMAIARDVTTDHVTFENLSPGRYGLAYSGSEIVSEEAEVELRPSEAIALEIRVRRGASCRFHLDFPVGARAQTIHMKIRSEQETLVDRSWTAQHLIVEEFLSQHPGSVPAGTWECEVSTDTGLRGVTEFRVRNPGDHQDVSVSLTAR